MLWTLQPLFQIISKWRQAPQVWDAWNVLEVPFEPAISWVGIEAWILGNKMLGINRVIGKIAGQVYRLSNLTSLFSILCFSFFDDKTIHPLLNFESVGC